MSVFLRAHTGGSGNLLVFLGNFQPTPSVGWIHVVAEVWFEKNHKVLRGYSVLVSETPI